MAPLDPRVDHDQARAYAKRIAQRLAATAPRPIHHLLSAGKARRAHIHRLSEERPRHDGYRRLVAAGAGGIPIAAPVSWGQVENGIRADAFTIEKPPRR